MLSCASARAARGTPCITPRCVCHQPRLDLLTLLEGGRDEREWRERGMGWEKVREGIRKVERDTELGCRGKVFFDGLRESVGVVGTEA